MSVKDAVGNELVEGDLVLVQLEHPFCIGRISKLKDGGLSLADASGKGKVSPGMMQIVCPQTIAYQPGPHAAIRVLFKLNNPASQSLVDELVQRANAGVPASVTDIASGVTAKPPVEE